MPGPIQGPVVGRMDTPMCLLPGRCEATLVRVTRDSAQALPLGGFGFGYREASGILSAPTVVRRSGRSLYVRRKKKDGGPGSAAAGERLRLRLRLRDRRRRLRFSCLLLSCALLRSSRASASCSSSWGSSANATRPRVIF